MEGREVARRLLQSHTLRVGAEMERYVAQHLAEAKPLAVMGEDARTGVARRVEIDPAALAGRG